MQHVQLLHPVIWVQKSFSWETEVIIIIIWFVYIKKRWSLETRLTHGRQGQPANRVLQTHPLTKQWKHQDTNGFDISISDVTLLHINHSQPLKMIYTLLALRCLSMAVHFYVKMHVFPFSTASQIYVKCLCPSEHHMTQLSDAKLTLVWLTVLC